MGESLIRIFFSPQLLSGTDIATRRVEKKAIGADT